MIVQKELLVLEESLNWALSLEIKTLENILGNLLSEQKAIITRDNKKKSRLEENRDNLLIELENCRVNTNLVMEDVRECLRMIYQKEIPKSDEECFNNIEALRDMKRINHLRSHRFILVEKLNRQIKRNKFLLTDKSK